MTDDQGVTGSFTLRRRGLDLRFRRARLAGREWETPDFVRVRLEGDELEGFDSPGADDHLRLFFPGDESPDDVGALRAAPSREYTPAAWGPRHLDIGFAVHGAPGARGVAAEWAATAPLGAAVGVGGPRGAMIVDGDPHGWFLAGDETAVPAIRRFAARMRADAVGRVLVEVADAGHELPVATPAGVAVSYVHRGSEAAGSALAARLDGYGPPDRPPGDVFAFVAAEQSIVRHGRALVLERWGIAADRVVVKGYWKRDEVAYHAPH